MDGLISNALKFSAPGGQVFIRVEKTPDRQAKIQVRTPGVALDSKDATRIFEDGFKGTSVLPQRFGGLGIRLSLIRDIVIRQGGKIWLENQPPKNLAFFVSFPLTRS